MADEPSPPAPAPTGPRILLGIFIVGQLFFLVAGNAVEMLNGARDELPRFKDATQVLDRALPGWPNKQGHFHNLSETLTSLTDRWASLTGQTQGWSLFAPEVRKHCLFPAVLIRWDEEPLSAPALARPLAALAATNPLETAALRAAASVPLLPRAAETLLSRNEPHDVNNYFRWGKFRLRRYENNILPELLEDEQVTPAQTKERWRDTLAKHVEKYGDVTKAYLQWRWEDYRRAHPGAPVPMQLILVVRRHALVPPAEAPPYWRGPFTVPVARWQPHVVWEGSYGPLERYDPVTGRFHETRN